MRKQTKIWTTRFKRRIRICDMTDSHLRNTIKFLETQANAIYDETVASGWQFLSMLQGEMAIRDCENGLDSVEREGPSYFYPKIYWNLVQDAERRGIAI